MRWSLDMSKLRFCPQSLYDLGLRERVAGGGVGVAYVVLSRG